MTLTHDLYRRLLTYEVGLSNKNSISTVYSGSAGTQLIYARKKDNELRQLYFKAGQADSDDIPSCNGIDVKRVRLEEYSREDYYIELSQRGKEDGEIFEVIVEDIRKRAENDKTGYMIPAVFEILQKWKKFFAQEHQLLLTTERQQGLYGELLFLRKAIETFGAIAVNYWSGCKYETHDFYIKRNAIEVKTTMTKAPYKVRISSEYQLDQDDVSKNLFLVFYALRKSESDGETLPEIVENVRRLLIGQPLMLQKFSGDLEEYGYFDGLEDKYTTGYLVRDKFLYEVIEGFPRLTRKDLKTGISGCSYDLLVDVCNKFSITENDLIERLKGK